MLDASLSLGNAIHVSDREVPNIFVSLDSSEIHCEVAMSAIPPSND